MSSDQTKPLPTGMKILLWIIGLPIGCIVILMVIGAFMPDETGADRAAKIDQSCEREYGPDPQAVSSCKTRLYTEELARRDRSRADRARTGAGM